MLKAKKSIDAKPKIHHFTTVMKNMLVEKRLEKIFEHVNISDLYLSKSQKTWALVSASLLITNI